MYLLIPVSDLRGYSARMILESLFSNGWFVIQERGSGNLKRGDQICIYEKRVGIVAKTTVASSREPNSLKFSFLPSQVFKWAFRIEKSELFSDSPIVLDIELRRNLQAFEGKDPSQWAWFVQSTHSVSEQDFNALTNRSKCSQRPVVKTNNIRTKAF